MSFLNELKRRNVLRVGAAYIVSSWLLIQVSETIFPLFGFGDTPARLVVIVLAIAFVPSLIFSWVFEITPEGLKKDADVDREQSITHVTGKKLDRIILVVLALGLGLLSLSISLCWIRLVTQSWWKKLRKKSAQMYWWNPMVISPSRCCHSST